MKNKLNLTKQDARKIHDEFYEPVRLLEEAKRPPELKRPIRPQKAVNGVTTKK